MQSIHANENLGPEGGQAATVRFLSDPASYRLSQADLERFDTHAAIVVLAGADAYKIKRAVTYNYLDFSTLEKRRKAIEHEFEVNRVNAPDTYLGVVPIVRNPEGNLSFGGAGEVVEWALHMRRFATSAILSNLFAADPPQDQAIRDLAQTVVRLHAGAAQVITSYEPARIGAIVEELREALSEFEKRLPPAAVDAFIDRAHAELDRVRFCLKIRGRRGCIRRCHGDLHLGNIVQIDGKPVVFDAIEFDDELATIDVLYDLAFLIMDLDMRGYGQAANLLLNRYLQITRSSLDIYGLAAMPLFLAIRAGIRAMVALQRGADGDRPAEDEAWRYLDRALGYLSLRSPMLLAVGGCSGAGKSTLARGLAPIVGDAPGAIHLSSDIERKDLAGADELQRLGDEGYTPEVTAAVQGRLQSKAARILRGGASVIVDATFLHAQDRNAIEAIARRLKIPFAGLWLAVSLPVAQARVEARRADVSDATRSVVERQFAAASPPTDWIQIDSGGTPEQTLVLAQSYVADWQRSRQLGRSVGEAQRPSLQSEGRGLFCDRWQQSRSVHCPP